MTAPRIKHCPACLGDGGERGALAWVTCQECKGLGLLYLGPEPQVEAGPDEEEATRYYTGNLYQEDGSNGRVQAEGQ